ncbi:hypothetical protein EDS67_26965 [candidate division KSB1 bacterium]|nr:MAG: hypothetical protein EDS67_26965 [candidate division KSB1 bacterium]MBC6950367.1 hypothetical protein [candidate division KSB1 bacterium]MCE7944945.1 hypothetical protein [Chlorobi bacterium CHB1]
MGGVGLAGVVPASRDYSALGALAATLGNRTSEQEGNMSHPNMIVESSNAVALMLLPLAAAQQNKKMRAATAYEIPAAPLSLPGGTNSNDLTRYRNMGRVRLAPDPVQNRQELAAASPALR